MIGQELKYTAAMVAARRNFEGNLRAIGERQPSLGREVMDVAIEVEWVFGRDGSLTARANEEWWSGCSLPRRTADLLLKTMELKGTCICFLSPTHAGQVRVTLDRMIAGQALIIAVPDLADLRVMLGCEGFEPEIRAGRLWFAWGERWAGELEALLSKNDGLPTPGQFVRTGLVEKEQLDGMIRAAQDVFSRETGRRSQVVRSLFEGAAVDLEQVCVIAPSAFRVWEDVGNVMSELAAGGWGRIDPDHPCKASSVAFARAAAGCGTVLVVNCGRGELPGELPAETRVISWITGPRIPQYEAKGGRDVLLVADERWRGTAISAGWPAERVQIAGWPVEAREKAGSGLGIICDTRVMVKPEFELSSQKILWDSILQELSRDPFAAGLDAQAYLGRWLRQAGIPEETVDRGAFIDGLIVPAYQQGLARRLTEAGVDVKLFGQGWDELEEFAARHAGEIRDRQGLRIAIEACAALVHVWPAGWKHPIEATGRAVLKLGSKSAEMWLTEAKKLARGEVRPAVSSAPIISIEVVRRVIGSC